VIPKLLGQKMSKFTVRPNFSCSTAFFLINIYWSCNNWYWYSFACL